MNRGSGSPARQEPLVRDLLRPENLPGHPARVEFRFTHGSYVFLTEHRAYKVKRAKDYGFFDYSTLEARRHFCEEEVRLNRRTAPEVYLGVLPVYRDDQGYSLTRPGEVADYAVEMVRLPDERSALAMLERGALGPAELQAVAGFAAGFYRRAEEWPPDPEGLIAAVEENFRQLAPYAERLLDAGRLRELAARQRAWLQAHGKRLALRKRRDGHGDLRLEHVYFSDQGPILIDCIEFLDRFRIADPALDIAFLAMELMRYGRAELAESFLQAFASESGDYGFYPLIDGYLSYRATVRAKVACLVAGDAATPAEQAGRKAKEAAVLLDLALRCLSAPPNRRFLVAVGGSIATGKSTLAAELSRVLLAPVVQADRVRKQLAGLRPDERGGEELYRQEFTRRVQQRILEDLQAVLESGRPAIADTTCRSRDFRARLRQLAKTQGAPFLLVEVQVAEETARRRLRQRRGGVSDAREELLEDFLAGFEPITELPEAEHVRADGSRPPAAVVAELLAGPLAALSP